MSHTVKDHDGMKVLVVSDMDRRFDEDGKLVSSKDMENVELVHAKEIAKFFGIPLRSVGQGDNEVHGVWHMVHSNQIGQRVAYNSEEEKPGNRNVRTWTIIKDASGNAIDTKEEIKRFTTHHEGVKRTQIPLVEELDDGMYVRLADVLEYAAAMGWKKGGGLPGTGATKAHAEDISSQLKQLTETVQALATIVTQQTIAAAHAPKGVK